MWSASLICILLIGLTCAEPQYNYPSPSNPLSFPQQIPKQCDPIRSVVYTTRVQDSVAFQTQKQVNTQFRTVTSYQDRVIPTTLYQTQFRTQVQYQTSFVQSQTQVVKEQVATETQRGRDVVNTRYVSSVQVVPQVSQIVRERVETQVVPVERVNTRFETQYKDEIQYRTSQVVRTMVTQVRDRDVFSTAYRTQVQTSFVQQPAPAQTKYRTTTLVQQSIQLRTIPGQQVVRTNVAYSTQVVPTTQFRTRNEDRHVTRTQYVTRTNVRTMTQVQTRHVTQTVTVTRDVQKEVVRTEYTTRVVPQTRYNTQFTTQYNNVAPVISTRVSHYQSVVEIPGQDRVVNREVVNTQQRQEVVYRTQNVQRQSTVYRTVQAPCQQQQGYQYQQPAVSFNY